MGSTEPTYKGCVYVSLSDLAEMLGLPDGVRPVFVQVTPDQDAVRLVVEGDGVPVVYGHLPTVPRKSQKALVIGDDETGQELKVHVSAGDPTDEELAKMLRDASWQLDQR